MMLAIQPTLTQLTPAPAAPKQGVEPVEPCDGADCFDRSLRDADRAVQRDEAAANETPDEIETAEVEEASDTEVVDETETQEEPQDVIDESTVVAEVPAQPVAREVVAAASGAALRPVTQEQDVDDELLVDDEDGEPALKLTEAKTEHKVESTVGTAREGDVAVNRHGQPHLPTPGNASVQGVESAAAQGLADRPVVVTTTPLAAAQLQSAVDQLESNGEVDPNVARVARGLQSALAQRGGAVTLRLQPPELGVVRIAVDIRDGVVRATFQAESESVRSMLSHQIGRLRHALEGQGLAIERLEVHTQTAQSALEQQMARENDAEAEARSRGRREGGQPDQRREGQQEDEPRFEQTLRDRVVTG